MPDMVFTGRQLRILKSPVVYILRDGEDQPVYVGMSSRGIERAFNKSHHAIRSVTNNHRLEVLFCATKRDAIALERKLILDLRPQRNRPLRGSADSPTIETGIVRHGDDCLRAFVRIHRKRLVTRVFPPDTPIETIRAWREEQKTARTPRKSYRRVTFPIGQTTERAVSIA
jgi:excinuclease UvrABC nuclease subunit